MKFKGKRKIPFEEANERLHKVNSSFDLIEYDGISKPCKVQCRECGCTLEFASVQSAIVSMGNECYECNKIEHITSFCSDLSEVKTVGEFINICNKYQKYKIDTNIFGYQTMYNGKYKKYSYSFIKRYFINNKLYILTTSAITEKVNYKDDININTKLKLVDTNYFKCM